MASQRRFITDGDSDDLSENILQMVLARPVGAGPGTKGLSLFVTGLEHKMGLKASATCELTFGQHGFPAVGWLVGDRHNGNTPRRACRTRT